MVLVILHKILDKYSHVVCAIYRVFATKTLLESTHWCWRSRKGKKEEEEEEHRKGLKWDSRIKMLIATRFTCQNQWCPLRRQLYGVKYRDFLNATYMQTSMERTRMLFNEKQIVTCVFISLVIPYVFIIFFCFELLREVYKVFSLALMWVFFQILYLVFMCGFKL